MLMSYFRVCKLWEIYRKFKSTTGVQKVNKNAEKCFQLFYADCIQQFKIFPDCFTCRLFIPPLLNLFRCPFSLWLQAIENRHWYSAWTNQWGKMIHFVLENQGKLRENKFCRSVGTMFILLVLICKASRHNCCPHKAAFCHQLDCLWQIIAPVF